MRAFVRRHGFWSACGLFLSVRLPFWWARVDIASRASKKAPQGLFSPPDCSAGRCCSNPPAQPRESYCKTENPAPGSDTGFLGGRGWIRTTEAESSRFTVCPHWPLGNTPIFISVRPFAGRLAYFSMGNGFCQLFFTFFFKGFLRLSKAGCGNAAGFVRKRRTSVFFAAKNLLDKRQILRFWIAFCAILCYNSGRTEQKTAGAFCRFAR